MKATAFGAFVLLASLSGFGQDKNKLDHAGCKVYFTVFWADAHIPGGYAPGMHKEQKKWYEKTLVKKYPTVCMSAEKATYAMSTRPRRRVGMKTKLYNPRPTTYTCSFFRSIAPGRLLSLPMTSRSMPRTRRVGGLTGRRTEKLLRTL